MNKALLTLFCAVTALTVRAQTFFKDANGKWGLKDAKGQILVAGKYNAAGKFESGLAIVKSETPVGELSGVIDATGKEIVGVKYAEIELGRFGSSQHVLLIKAQDFNAVFWTLIDPKTGKDITIPGRYYAIEPFINGVARVEGQNNTTGVIDEAGKEIIALGTAEQIAAGLMKNGAPNQTDEALLSLFKRLVRDQKNSGKEYQSSFEIVAKAAAESGDFTRMGVLYRDGEAYKALMDGYIDEVHGLPSYAADGAFHNAIINFCKKQNYLVNVMYSFVKDFQNGKKPNKYQLQGALSDASGAFDKMTKEYGDYTRGVPKPTPKPVAAENKTVVIKPKFGAPANDNEVFYLTEDWTSKNFKDRIGMAIRSGNGYFAGSSGLQFDFRNSNFEYADERYVFNNGFDVYKVESIGYGGFYRPEDADTKRALFINSKNREITVEMRNLSKSKNAFYGIVLFSSSDNDQKKFEIAGPGVVYPPRISYALLINNSGYKIVKYKGYRSFWDKKENQELMINGKLSKQNADSAHTFSINKTESKWDFYLDGNLIHTLTDNTFLHVNADLGHFIVTGKSRIQLMEYKFIGKKGQ